MLEVRDLAKNYGSAPALAGVSFTVAGGEMFGLLGQPAEIVDAPLLATSPEGVPVLMEHTSINPNAEPHVGRARNAIVGDALYDPFAFYLGRRFAPVMTTRSTASMNTSWPTPTTAMCTCCSRPMGWLQPPRPPTRSGASSRDRKSTRLNSSH